MRGRAIVLLFGLGACSAGLLEASGEPPSGYGVGLTTTFSQGIVPTSGSIFGAGDSVIATVTRPATCGRTVSAVAGTSDAGLVITLMLAASGVQNCTPLNGMTTYRAALHGIPAGSYDASVHVRLMTNGANSDTAVARATVRLP